MGETDKKHIYISKMLHVSYDDKHCGRKIKQGQVRENCVGGVVVVLFCFVSFCLSLFLSSFVLHLKFHI